MRKDGKSLNQIGRKVCGCLAGDVGESAGESATFECIKLTANSSRVRSI